MKHFCTNQPINTPIEYFIHNVQTDKRKKTDKDCLNLSKKKREAEQNPYI